MTHYIFIRLHGVAEELKLQADEAEIDGAYLIVKRAKKEVGQFNLGAVQGWWHVDQ